MNDGNAMDLGSKAVVKVPLPCVTADDCVECDSAALMSELTVDGIVTRGPDEDPGDENELDDDYESSQMDKADKPVPSSNVPASIGKLHTFIRHCKDVPNAVNKEVGDIEASILGSLWHACHKKISNFFK